MVGMATVLFSFFFWFVNIFCLCVRTCISMYSMHVCRMILAGQLVKHVARNKVEIFRFDQEYDLTYEQTIAVSDHYPIGLVVQSKYM